MVDVARLAGVSPQTVSRVSTGFQGVRESTRNQVLAAMEDLGYRPNMAGRALKWGAFRTLGVIVSDLITVGNVRTVDAIARSAADHGYAITLVPVEGHTRREVAGAFTRLDEMAVDAVILVLAAELVDKGDVPLPPRVPVVLAYSESDVSGMIVSTDQVHGARLATEYLLELGHGTVHHLAGPEVSYAARHREREWRTVLGDRGLPIPEVVRGDWSASSGYEAGRQLAQQACTAVFAANDQMALGLLRALALAGRDVPGDVSVVGFDDLADAEQYQPPLTTIRQDFSEVGRRCVSAALELVESGGDRRPAISLVPCELVVRNSTAPPPRRPDSPRRR